MACVPVVRLRSAVTDYPTGGVIRPAGTDPDDDRVPLTLTTCYVVPAAAVDGYGADLSRELNEENPDEHTTG